jgi:hypothetical protein
MNVCDFFEPVGLTPPKLEYCHFLVVTVMRSVQLFVNVLLQ